MAGILKEKGYDTEIFKENLKMPDKLDCDILAINVLTAEAPRAYELAREFKENNPDKKVIMGGPHVSALPKEALRYADQVVIGEGEDVIVDMVEGKIKERIIHGSQVNLNKLPFPDFSLIYGLKRLDFLPISTSRGCPFNCKFCTVTKIFGRNYRFRKSDLVIEELKRTKSKKIFFYDDHFCSNRPRTIDLLKKMKEHGLTKRKWISQTRVDIANDENLLKLMSDTNCYRLFLGLESINQKTLESYNKRQVVKDIKNAIKKIKDHSIEIWGAFIFGSDEDDKTTVKKTLDFCDDMEIDLPQFSILTPFPGTDTYNELKPRIFTDDWGLYDGTHVVFEPKNFSASELQNQFLDAFTKAYYNIKNGLKRIPNYKDAINPFRIFKVIKWAKRFRDENLNYIERLKNPSYFSHKV
jgi:radical SAM superfamily enzyme YgiQ (UPF0313 family)